MSSIVNFSVSQVHPREGANTEAVPTITYHIQTLWLFVKSDIVGMVIPVMAFSTLITSNTSPTRVAKTFIWTAVHLLQFCTSNQSIQPGEDVKNKPWRPIPSGRIKVENTIILRWTMLGICLGLSVAFGVLDVGIMLAIVTFVYNECGYNAHWFPRTILVPMFYLIFDTGAILISLTDRSEIVDPKILLPLIINPSVIITTIHAQDFHDLIGDIQEGRRTLPIIFPRASRVSMPFLTIAWAAILLALNPDWNLVDWAVLLLGAYVGLRFYFIREVGADRLSYTLYNIWLVVIRVALVLAKDSMVLAVSTDGWIGLSSIP